MQDNKQNIKNLTALWQAYGAEPIYATYFLTMYRSVNWPYRHWFEFTRDVHQVSSEQFIDHLEQALTHCTPDAIIATFPSLTNLAAPLLK